MVLDKKCRVCEKWIEDGQTIVGLPVFRVMGQNSRPAGSELLFHVRCFLVMTKQEQVTL